MAIEIIGGTEMLIYAMIMIFGAMLAVVFPYILNRIKDPNLKINWVYVAILLFSIFIAVVFGLPDQVETINISTIKIALLAGYGLQAFIGKLVKAILEYKTEEPEP